MKIGIIGCGIVGGALKYGFESVLGHTVKIHDPKFNTKLEDVLKTEINYICVPTKMLKDGSCDTSIVESVVKELCEKHYAGIIVIKSTVEPGTTDRLISWCKSQNMFRPPTICNAAEIIRERSNEQDFVENLRLLPVGTYSKDAYDRVVECHGNLPKKTLMCKPIEGEILKYMHNTVNALRVVFSNEFYEICQKSGADYNVVKRGLLETTGLPDAYINVNKNLRGYSSVCLNKDPRAIRQYAKKLGLNLKLLNIIDEANDMFKKTPIEGTRENYAE